MSRLEYDFVAVQVGGEPAKLRFCHNALVAAMRQGWNLASLLDPPEDIDSKDDAVSEIAALEYNLRILWWGMLAYEPELTLEDLGMRLGVLELPAAGAAAQDALAKYVPTLAGAVGAGKTAAQKKRTTRRRPKT